ncbi:uncharacterized protein LOC116805736 [Drosophila grimshawi]|uniref:uncharacterized protein LOC116805736 n=1 Tax=Drosophila grimshawi TaxID=7222 RepID=UPI000C86EA8F|nr:uncharacterized protein LOC116805736 [Drosophila grimshawi]
MTDVNWAAYNAFRCDLAKVHKTFSSCTQTKFTEEVGTLTDCSLCCKFRDKIPPPVARRRQPTPPANHGK